MKRIILLALFSLSLNLLAQKTPIALFYPDSLLSNAPFINIDTSSQINTGILWDRIVPNIYLPAFTGNNEDTAAWGNITSFQPAMDLRRAALDSSVLPSRDSLSNHFVRLTYQHNATPLLVYNMRYNILKDNVLQDSLVSLDSSSGNFVFEPSLSTNPFEEKSFFALGLRSKALAVQDTLRFVVPSSFYFSNTAEATPTLEVNMKDGAGWRSISFDSPFEVIYNSEGGVDIEIELKATYGTVIKYAKLKKKLGQVESFPLPVNGPWLGDFVYNGTPMKYGFEAANGAWGNAYVRYRENPAAGEENVFRKPIIIVEGIDFRKTNQNGLPIGTSLTLGSAGWPTIWNRNDPDDAYPFEHFPAFLNQLYEAGYDVILLDFADGADYMQSNAMLLVELINRVNQYKLGDEGLVVLGASMGGQVARYALSYMETNNMDHCTRLFASFDSPWTGANIPLSVQFFVKYAAEEIDDDDAEQLKKDLGRAATKQLLKFHYLAAPCSIQTNNKKLWRYCTYPPGTTEYPHNLRTTFMNEVAVLGNYPKQCRNIAIANGAADGTAIFGNGSQYVDYKKTWSCLVPIPKFPYIIPVFLRLRFNLYSGGRQDNLVSSIDYPTKWWERTYIYNQPLIDNAPGGQRNDIKTIKKNIEAGFSAWFTFTCPNKGSVGTPEEQNTFIPSVSALNIASDDLYYDITNIDNNYPSEFGKTHFDAIYTDAFNGLHVEGTVDNPNTSQADGNLPWVYQQIVNGENLLLSQSPVLTKQWNVPLEANIINTLDIHAGGILYVNADEPRFDKANIIDNYAPSGGLARVFLGGNCSSTDVINVNSGGKMILGEITTANTAYVYITEGAELRINSGGELLVNKDSKLIVQKGGKLIITSGGKYKAIDESELVIEDGGELVYENNALIDLNPVESTLKIQGKLTIQANATFTFTGSGKVIFDQEVFDGTSLQFGDYMEIGTNAKLDLSGLAGTPPFTQKLVEVRKPVYFIDGNNNTFEEVDIRYGAVDLAPGALMYFYSKTDFHHVTVNSTGGGKHAGIRIWNSNGAGALFNNCSFSNGNFGVMADWLGGGPAIQIRNSHFTTNTTGISVNGGNFQITNNQFNNNGRGVVGSALSGTSSLGNCQVTAGSNGWLGIGLSSQNGALVNITATTIKDYNGGSGNGIDMVGVDARVTCSELLNNDVGINIWDGILYLDEDAGNEFINNTVGIQYDGNATETGIYLFEGHNKFNLGTNGLWYISGRTQGGGLLSTYHNATTVNANFNEMPLRHSSQTGLTFPVRFGINSTVNALSLSVQNNFQNNTNCNNPVLELEHPMLTPIAMESGVGGDGPYSIGNFKTGLTNAVANITFDENELDDLSAYLDLMDLLEATFTNRDASYHPLRHMAIGASMSALENSFQYEQLTHAEGGAVLTEVQRFIDILDNELDSLSYIDSNDQDAIFRYTLNKTQVYRVAGNYSQAMALFSNSSNWTFNNTQSMRAQYWDCICDAEKQLYDETIGIEDFGYLTEQCDINFAGFNYKRAEEVAEGFGIPAEVVLSNVSLYPQPVNEKLTVNFSGGFYGASDYTILNNSGQLVVRDKINWKGTSMEQINLGALTPGLYFITLDFGELGRKTYKITKE